MYLRWMLNKISFWGWRPGKSIDRQIWRKFSSYLGHLVIFTFYLFYWIKRKSTINYFCFFVIACLWSQSAASLSPKYSSIFDESNDILYKYVLISWDFLYVLEKRFTVLLFVILATVFLALTPLSPFPLN